MAKAVVNLEKCQDVCRRLAEFSIPIDHEDVLPSRLTSPLIGNLFFFAVAICHQTQNLRGDVDGVELRGWDYLYRKLMHQAEIFPSVLDPEEWIECSEEWLTKNLAINRMESESFNLQQRAGLIRNLGANLLGNGWKNIDQLHSHCKGIVANGNPSLLSCLNKFWAYDDPISKKSFFFLGLMSNSGLWNYSDPNNIGPPVDYHEVRGHLRLGTVLITNSLLEDKLIKSLPVEREDDLEIRSRVYEAIINISTYFPQNSPMQFHYLFWNLFRNICTRNAPRCFNQTSIVLPTQYIHFAIPSKSGRMNCPFFDICPSASEQNRYLEHQYLNHWY